MKPEQMHRAIASHCGWKDVTLVTGKEDWFWMFGTFKDEWIGKLVGWKDSDCAEEIPNYPECLNAMHEAEKSLSDDQLVSYRLRLCDNSDGPNARYRTVEAAMCHATADERAESFVHTIKKWSDE